jgi:hypothetical protein
MPDSPFMSGMAGKTVVVTGASSGIGLETARALAAQGARIAMVVRNRTRASLRSRDSRRVRSEARTRCRSAFARRGSQGGRELRGKPIGPTCRQQRRLDPWRTRVTVDGFERTFALNHSRRSCSRTWARSYLRDQRACPRGHCVIDSHMFARFD